MPQHTGFDKSSSNTLLLFGPQALSYDEAYFERVRLNVLGNEKNRWIRDVIEDLPSYWEELSEAIPSLSSIPGQAWLQRLSHWLLNGISEEQRTSPTPNIILSPIVVIGHLIEYIQHTTNEPRGQSGFGEEGYEQNLSNTETLGFCVGILSAFVVSSSLTRAQFCQNGAAALRLAMVIGGLVDAQDMKIAESQSISLATTWKAEQTPSKLHEVLESFPDVRTPIPIRVITLTSRYRLTFPSRMMRIELLLRLQKLPFQILRGDSVKLVSRQTRLACTDAFTPLYTIPT